jgi:hypothetical protein
MTSSLPASPYLSQNKQIVPEINDNTNNYMDYVESIPLLTLYNTTMCSVATWSNKFFNFLLSIQSFIIREILFKSLI